jgi:signal transduction histidine kinase
MILGIAIMLMMALSVVLFVFLYQKRSIRHQLEVKTLNEQKQMDLLQASIQSEEEERTRIAGELHDDVGATLSSVRLFLHKAAEDSPQAPLILQSRDLLDDSIRKVRDISHKLQPATLQSLGLYASLQAYAEMLNRSGSIKVLVNSGDDLPRLSNHTELHVYRIIQELVANTIKYSQASQIILTLTKWQGDIIVSVSHDGNGITSDTYDELLNKKGAIGLKNIANRLKFISGKIGFEKMNDNIYRTTITIPLSN